MKRFAIRCFHVLTLVVATLPMSASAQEDAVYRLGTDDVLRIFVPGRADLGVDVKVDSDGRIGVPQIGAVVALGLSTDELRRDLARRFNTLDSSVSEVLVSVLSYNSRQVTVVGEVRSAGSFGFRNIPDLVQILLRAGGTTAQANLAAIEIVRHERVEGEPHVVSVDLSDGLTEADPATLPEVRPHDTIIVPTRELQLTTGATFHVLGAVRTPGVYALQDQTTLVQALAVAGGQLPNANLSKVHLLREAETGAVAYQLNLEKLLLEGQPAVDLALQPGDTVTVPATRSIAGKVFSGFLGIAPVVTALSTLIFATSR